MTRAIAVFILLLCATNCMAATVAVRWTAPTHGHVSCDSLPTIPLMGTVWHEIEWWQQGARGIQRDSVASFPGSTVEWLREVGPGVYHIAVRPWTLSGGPACAWAVVKVTVDATPAGADSMSVEVRK